MKIAPLRRVMEWKLNWVKCEQQTYVHTLPQRPWSTHIPTDTNLRSPSAQTFGLQMRSWYRHLRSACPQTGPRNTYVEWSRCPTLGHPSTAKCSLSPRHPGDPRAGIHWLFPEQIGCGDVPKVSVSVYTQNQQHSNSQCCFPTHQTDYTRNTDENTFANVQSNIHNVQSNIRNEHQSTKHKLVARRNQSQGTGVNTLQTCPGAQLQSAQ